jgi:hypothetical protein
MFALDRAIAPGLNRMVGLFSATKLVGINVELLGLLQ